MLRWTATLMAFALAAANPAPAHAQFGGPEATAVKPGFVLPAGEARILVFRPEIAVGAQTTGGMNEPSAEWTRAARANLLAALARAPAIEGSTLVIAPELEGDKGALLNDYTALFKKIGRASCRERVCYAV